MNKLLYLLFTLIFSGCSMYQPPNTLANSDSRTVIADKELGQDIRILSTKIDHQRVSAIIVNHGLKERKLKIRFYWYADQGLEAAPFFSDIHEITLAAQRQLDVTEVIPNTSIVDFRVEIKE